MGGRCLVTGGAGFIGSHLVDLLVQNDWSVRAFDNFSTGLRSNLARASNLEVIEGTATDSPALLRAIRDCDVVFHLAALASVAKSIEDPAASHAVCATGTLNVLEAARLSGVRRVVYAGSASAYGGASDPAGQGEETPLAALSPYAAAKLAGEFYCQAYANAFPIETVRLRFFNVFGPRQRADSPYSGVIALFTAALTSGRTPTIHGDGLQSRDFVYVSDVVKALLLAATAPGISGGVYNVGTGQSITLLHLVDTLNRILGTTISARHGPARAGDIRRSIARIDRACADLGYAPKVAFEDGLQRTLAWYRESEK